MRQIPSLVHTTALPDTALSETKSTALPETNREFTPESHLEVTFSYQIKLVKAPHRLIDATLVIGVFPLVTAMKKNTLVSGSFDGGGRRAMIYVQGVSTGDVNNFLADHWGI